MIRSEWLEETDYELDKTDNSPMRTYLQCLKLGLRHDLTLKDALTLTAYLHTGTKRGGARMLDIPLRKYMRDLKTAQKKITNYRTI